MIEFAASFALVVVGAGIASLFFATALSYWKDH